MTRFALALAALLAAACGDTNIFITSLPIQAGVATIPNLGNVEVKFDFSALGGKSVSWKNGNDSAVGIKISKADDPGIDVLSDSWTSATDTGSRSGVNFEHGWDLEVEIIHYQTGLGSATMAFIKTLSRPNFSDHLEDSWVKARHRGTFRLE